MKENKRSEKELLKREWFEFELVDPVVHQIVNSTVKLIS